MKAETPLNILFLVGEDNGFHLGACGDRYAHTPQLDALADEGYFFPNTYATSPVCAPSRCTYASGRYAYSLGAHNMRSELSKPPRVFTEELRDQGYHVSWQGKTDFNFQPSGSFADDREPWLDRLAEGELPQPFLLYRNFGVTHESGMWPKPFNGQGSCDQRIAQQDKLREAPLPAAGEIEPPPYLPDHPEVRADLERFYQTLYLQDLEVAEIVEALHKSPYADNTILVYVADHGRGLPREKRWCYPAGVRVPLILWGKPLTQIADALDPDQLVSGVDIAPTLLDLAGVAIPDNYEGNSLLGNKTCEYVFGGRDRMDEVFDRVRYANDGRYHYIHNDFPQLPYASRLTFMERQKTTQVLRKLHRNGQLSEAAALWMAAEKPEEELYDLESDPCCVANLAQDPGNSELLHRMRKALGEHQREVVDLAQRRETQLVSEGVLEASILGGYASRVAELTEEDRFEPSPAPMLEEHLGETTSALDGI